MSFDALILGASGYGGGELLRWLIQHPQLHGLKGTAHSHAEKPFHAVHPNLRGLLEGAFDAEPDWGWLAGSEQPVLFSALPHGELAARLPEYERTWAKLGLSARLTVIDLSADFRWKEGWVYGLSEWKSERMSGARRIANPGCFATALQLALLPFSDLKPDFAAVTAITGSSGSGAHPSETTHHPARANDFRAYKPLSHQHEAEVMATLAAEGWTPELAFTPHSAPLVRGIFATAQLRLKTPLDEAALQARIGAALPGPFVRLVEGSPRVAAVAGSPFADIGFAAKGPWLSVMVALDNLGKGMATQGIQNLNLALGCSPMAGLRSAGAWPG
ncbi:MAG TPA: N-acetyl-gamma-glutamyl-phosphate reductase [Holophagaceae bacterium]|jgi:N-acetyl-gamma-glutamyl-phosphate/LysW-gamma-L-alpha-aminoadipyl-6-phosphate reductase|nr:N-acetyl-gamma-glutamyl-phosphate reductase [Holophagaceae bacterium]